MVVLIRNVNQVRIEEEETMLQVSKHVPIFLFSVDSEVPVFIDKYYQAKALADMVVVVQSDVPAWESRLSCNKQPIYWDLRNPLKAALSASSLMVGGLVPYHVGYNEASARAYQVPLHGTTTTNNVQNWLWSVGDNPLSYMSQHTYFSAVHRDIMFRNYLVSTINDSIEVINEGVALLLSQKTNIFHIIYYLHDSRYG